MSDTGFLDTVRGFNRFYTNKLGLLSKSYLDTAYTLTEARILYELGARQSVSATELYRSLALDPAYLSRILKKFRDADFVTSEPDPKDGRAQVLRVTAAGLAEAANLAKLSRAQLATELDGLDDSARVELVRAMAAIRELLENSERSDITLRRHGIGDMGWIIQSQATAYHREYGFNEKFEALVAKVAGAFIDSFNPERERCWIAERDGRRMGSVLVADGGGGVAKLRLLYLEPEARGFGLGRRMVKECIDFAQGSGYDTLSLWTNDVLISAVRIYERLGFTLVAQEKHNLFGPDCIGQTWELTLNR
jgi:DNA-binding MarR family transcriptional regulator/N-acetylglutamate synthase-like GNAT family acetyltransferase